MASGDMDTAIIKKEYPLEEVAGLDQGKSVTGRHCPLTRPNCLSGEPALT